MLARGVNYIHCLGRDRADRRRAGCGVCIWAHDFCKIRTLLHQKIPVLGPWRRFCHLRDVPPFSPASRAIHITTSLLTPLLLALLYPLRTTAIWHRLSHFCFSSATRPSTSFSQALSAMSQVGCLRTTPSPLQTSPSLRPPEKAQITQQTDLDESCMDRVGILLLGALLLPGRITTWDQRQEAHVSGLRSSRAQEAKGLRRTL
ncbi:hypothetical protein B0J15DRAFT_486914 [Fusarium solani]|uniref:Uncharacterized protein n=1 Tax=Fusarium solani TaxID=169388 RepID=A0A9P9R801_FUSSL|nr:uncharacterized protein B0J15DRAFT_486914 [Fusarium solani]KAH7268703.1 hypothetical protein B0J15DRAFT_486914 [Fusarium solani]